jgi:hypothetical protein
MMGYKWAKIYVEEREEKREGSGRIASRPPEAGEYALSCL